MELFDFIGSVLEQVIAFLTGLFDGIFGGITGLF
jgi:hypothetical protein